MSDEFDFVTVKHTWGTRLLLGAPVIGAVAGWVDSPGVFLVSIAVMLLGAWLYNSWKHDVIMATIYAVARRVIVLEKLAGVEHEFDDDGHETIKFRGDELNLIQLEDLAARMRQTPLDIDDGDINVDCDA